MSSETERILKTIQGSDRQFTALQNEEKSNKISHPLQLPDDLPMALLQRQDRFNDWRRRSYWAGKSKLRSFRKN